MEERESVACSTNFTNFRDGGGGFLHFRPANALVTSKSRIGTRQGRIGVEIGGGARVDLRVKFSRDGEDIFFNRSEFRVQFVRCLIRYRCIEHFFERFPVTEGSNDACKASLNLVGLGGL